MHVPRRVIRGGLVLGAVFVDEGFPVADGGDELVEPERLGVLHQLRLGPREGVGDGLARRPRQPRQHLGMALGDLPRRQRGRGGGHVPEPARQPGLGPHLGRTPPGLPGQPRRSSLRPITGIRPPSREHRSQPRLARRQPRLETVKLDEPLAQLVVGERVRVEPSQRIGAFSDQLDPFHRHRV
jgi:hypothetical protein